MKNKVISLLFINLITSSVFADCYSRCNAQKAVCDDRCSDVWHKEGQKAYQICSNKCSTNYDACWKKCSTDEEFEITSLGQSACESDWQ